MEVQFAMQAIANREQQIIARVLERRNFPGYLAETRAQRDAKTNEGHFFLSFRMADGRMFEVTVRIIDQDVFSLPSVDTILEIFEQRLGQQIAQAERLWFNTVDWSRAFADLKRLPPKGVLSISRLLLEAVTVLTGQSFRIPDEKQDTTAEKMRYALEYVDDARTQIAGVLNPKYSEEKHAG